MDEKPKSIWKKSWKGPRAFLFWLLTVLIAAFLAAVAIAAITFVSTPTPLFAWRGGFGNFIGCILIVMFWFIVAVAVAFAFYKLIRWLFCWRNLKRTLFAVACLITLIALFYAEEDWRGWHAWQKFKHEWEAKGEHFDFASVVPPPVPEDQNFALTPIVASSYLFILDKNGHRISPLNTNVVNRLNMMAGHNDEWPTNGTGNWQKSTMSDLKVWQNYYRSLAAKTNEFSVPSQPQSPAADVLLALSKYDSVIEELREASRLPGSRFPLNYDSESPSAILLPHLTALRSCSQTLQLRSLAELQYGQPEETLADVKLALQLAGKIRTEPFLISHLVRIRMVNFTLQPVYEGLAEHKWSDAQLVALDAELAKLNFLADYKLSMRGEMGCQGGEADRVRRHPEQLEGLSGMNDGDGGIINQLLPGKFIARLIPTGWFYQNQLRCARMMVDYYLPVADVNQGIVSPAQVRRGDAALIAETKTASPFNVLERLMLPALGVVRRFAYAQTSVDLARTAIALERYRLARGEFPESLDALAPQFIAKLPHDIINGQPLHYRQTSDGKFILYSVGWNETDDGGEVGLRKDGSVNIEKGDWVWRYPAK